MFTTPSTTMIAAAASTSRWWSVPVSPAASCRDKGRKWRRSVRTPTSLPATYSGVVRGSESRSRSPSLPPQTSGSASSVPLGALATVVRPWGEEVERVLWTAAEIAARVAELAAEISEDFQGSDAAVAVVGVATGAFVFLADLVRGMALPVTVDFVRVESYGCSTESSGTPAIVSDVKADIKGKRVLLVEDIVDTGKTLSFLISHMKSKGACSVSVCTFLDKPARRSVHFELVGDGKFYRGFECPDYFVVGYGMDFSERYRNMPFIGVLKPASYQL